MHPSISGAEIKKNSRGVKVVAAWFFLAGRDNYQLFVGIKRPGTRSTKKQQTETATSYSRLVPL